MKRQLPHKMTTEKTQRIHSLEKNTFEECILIPRKTYEEQLKNGCFTTKDNHLQQGIIPDDLKIKYLDQSRRAVLKRPIDFEEREMVSLLEKIPKNIPFVDEIVKNYIRYHKSTIHWHPFTFEIIINGNTLANTNIARTLQFLLKPETTQIAPKGTNELRNALINIGVPESWIAYHSNDQQNKGKIFVSSETKEDLKTPQFYTISPPKKMTSEKTDVTEESFSKYAMPHHKKIYTYFFITQKKTPSPSLIFDITPSVPRRSKRPLKKKIKWDI